MAAGRGYGLKGSEIPNKDSLIANAALGQGGAWWVKFRDGSVMWDLAGGYVELQLLLKENAAAHNNINYLALSPYSEQHYFLDYEDNKVRYSLPAGYARLIGPEIDEYHASRVTVSGAHLAIGGASERDADSGAQYNEPPPYSAPKT
ncbi:hypothetical protein OIDMADRAFT_59192 [Oidiodendron maius Zn]|uniref:Uncharacterized protein n=1 Tax=Oidiodendron maius (strain Zn) TaxID=913774 RepID=A0A0C3D2J3_OIDMZ|nr:hypothetical protein OIDMADRAFT_59192 [Oidiodendron maius Zn]